MIRGLPVRVERYGQSGPTLVFLHGFAANNVTWYPWLNDLESDYRIHLVEMRGHGTAPTPKGASYAPRAYARDVAAYVRSLEDGEVTLVGHSMGGGIALLAALRLAEEDSDRVRAIVSVAGAAYPQSLPPFVKWARRKYLARFLLWLLPKHRLLRLVLRSIVWDPDSVTEAQIEAYAAPLRRGRVRRAILETARLIVPPDLKSRAESYRSLDMPVLALWGRHDHVVPLAVGERLKRELPNVELVVLEECGHIPTEERPGPSLEAFRAFLDGVYAGTT